MLEDVGYACGGGVGGGEGNAEDFVRVSGTEGEDFAGGCFVLVEGSGATVLLHHVGFHSLEVRV